MTHTLHAGKGVQRSLVNCFNARMTKAAVMDDHHANYSVVMPMSYDPICNNNQISRFRVMFVAPVKRLCLRRTEGPAETHVGGNQAFTSQWVEANSSETRNGQVLNRPVIAVGIAQGMLKTMTDNLGTQRASAFISVFA